MKINTAALLIAFGLPLAGCTQSPPQPAPAPHGGTAAATAQPQLVPQARPAPPPPAPRTSAASWRDLPQTAGSWAYTAENTGSAIRFSQPGAAPLLIVRCDRSRPAIVIQRPGFGTTEAPATITTSSVSRRLTAAPAGIPSDTGAPNAAGTFQIVLAPRDPLLDAMAFSRGRFMLEMGGAQTLVLPAWSELGSVIEDCR